MRYVLAILALAISGVLLLLGIGQRTFLAAPTEIVYPIEFESDTDYAIISAEELSKVGGQANLVMRGEDAFAAVAKERDVLGWVAPFGASQLDVDTTDHSVVVVEDLSSTEPVSELLEVDEDGTPIPLDPRGSDLWLETRSGDNGAFRMPVSLTPNQALLIAGNGENPIPEGASIVWVQDRATPWAGPLLVAGGFFALLGGVLYLIAFDRDRRALGPRRGRKGPLLGVRNVIGGSRKRAKVREEPRLVGDTPKQGSLTNAPVITAGSQSESTERPEAEQGEPADSNGTGNERARDEEKGDEHA